ncbi:MAG: ABC transporter ATP-binding protein [Deltaproteobacteria bacterium]|nr:MAG: ABC transporter ATP-binding protein [Deltaproteobacteria bacterium]
MAAPLIEIEGLRTAFHTDDGTVVAVDGVDLTICEGETLGVVGESGCGKSVTAMSILRLIPDPPGRIVGGTVRYRGRDLLTLPEEEMRRIRGKKISMIFQEPMTSLNPVFTVGDQIGEAVRLHEGASKREARDRAIEMLRLVGIPAPEQRVDAYPHQLSGGMRQRVMIAMALACDPDLLIADEPTTALDVTIQAQILELIKRLQEERGMAVMMITHDLGVVAETCDEVAVMYAGKVVERASVEEIFARPRHPYTLGLLRSIPSFDVTGAEKKGRLPAIPGTVPSLLALPGGCRFRTRCERVVEGCKVEEPPLVEVAPAHTAACVNPAPEGVLS